jgi:uncharacterized protein YggL (DUF469 family)
MSKPCSRRLRKKLRVGEFHKLGFAISFQFHSEISESDTERFWDAFITEIIERNGLAYGGGRKGFVMLWGRGSVTEGHRELLRAWLALRAESASFRIGSRVDAWYGPSAEWGCRDEGSGCQSARGQWYSGRGVLAVLGVVAPGGVQAVAVRGGVSGGYALTSACSRPAYRPRYPAFRGAARRQRCPELGSSLSGGRLKLGVSCHEAELHPCG